ncbi:hypothetical protein [Povalibacter sp.]|uniref:hypothetical protein n=1 Tax=Povalibacter sp. TaxID=1962978 RepID=UPI002F3ECF0E
MSDFALDIRRFVEKAKANADLVVRKVALDLLTRVVQRTPVGNPELWASNAEAALQRSEHNGVVDHINAMLISDPANVTVKGNLRRKVRSRANRRLSRSQLAKEYPFKAGQGYVGGRLRGSWTVTAGTPSTTEPGRIDPDGSETIAAAAAALASFTAGPSIYITSNVPYANRIEYTGHSSQAPAGMVRVSITEFQQFVDAAVQSLP